MKVASQARRGETPLKTPYRARADGGGLRSSASLEAEAMEEGILQARRRESLAAAETLQRAWRGR